MPFLNDLLELTRLSADDCIFTPSKVNIAQLVQQVFSILAENAQLKHISLLNKVDGEHFVKADSNLLRIVIQNLVSNAVKFTWPGGHVEVSSETDGAWCQIHVADNGIGIPEKDMSKVLSPDISFTTRGTANETGTGLGISISKEMAEKMNGSITVKSVVSDHPSSQGARHDGSKSGTIFTLKLPKF